ncbi:hypothetical protein [Stakelama pacifica]|uniref:Uncharacterized protein n=1 Tax=Stakelama pacifica TaxID=517720 RepID=A0A4R6FS91_9SPHN|nr:hypothetical protein [Stakelama pacifica]TDN84621.1 hypothetical protein EV664_103267 [Stakelama pacifica]GGO93269.1 hypothetical protein GCM10011329_12290 [Stakelama pacifica]
MAAFGFKGFGWFLCTAIVAPGCYLVTSQVAAERSRVESVNRAIVEAHKDIRDLDTEIKTRANMAQLERWNGDLLALSAPRPDQFLDAGAQGVAELDNGGRPDGPVAYASLVVPHAPVLTDGPGMPDAAPEAALDVKEPEAPVPGRAAVSTQRRAAPVATAALDTAKDRTVAMLDERLLSESTLGDLMRGARAEARPH